MSLSTPGGATNNCLSYAYLQSFLGVSRLSLWSCPSCGPSFLPSSIAPSPHYAWGVVLLCGFCNSSWLVCRECPNVRSRFISGADCLGHHRRKHRHDLSKVGASHALANLCFGNASGSFEGSVVARHPKSPFVALDEPSLQRSGSDLIMTPVAVMSDGVKPCTEVLLPTPEDSAGVSSNAAKEEAGDGRRISSGNSVSNVTPCDFVFFGEHNAHKFIVIDVPSYILEAMYAAVSVFPVTQYEVICGSLKQSRFYNSFNMLFPEGSCLWDEFLCILKGRFFKYHPHLDINEINATVIITDGPMAKPQQPHMDYSWESILLPTRCESRHNKCKLLRGSCQIPFTGHLPVSRDGSYIYLWSGPGVAIPFHIQYGKMLVIRGDVVHCGGLPPSAPTNKLFHRVHFYFPTCAVDIPPNSIYGNNYDGQSFSRDYVFPADVA